MRGAIHFTMGVKEKILASEGVIPESHSKRNKQELQELKGQTHTSERQRPGSETDSKKAKQLGKKKNKQTSKHIKAKMKSKPGSKLTKKEDVAQMVKKSIGKEN